MWEGYTPPGFVGGVVSFREDEDIWVVGGGEVFHVHDGSVKASGVEIDEV